MQLLEMCQFYCNSERVFVIFFPVISW